MRKEIVIVTAFFAINRENWAGFSRSNELYFSYFKSWASLKNKLIVYVESQRLKDEILSFRSSIGLENKTIVNIIPNILDVDKELLESIESVSNLISRKFRLYPNNPECWNATYNYIMLMKQWCAADAVKRGQVDSEDTLAWIDFGFNHGGKEYSLQSNFNFLWKFDFPDTINLFSTQPLDDRPIFEIVQSMDTYIMGMLLVGTAKYWEEFRLLVRESMMELNHCGMMDDDQNIILMAVRKRPELFNVKVSAWDKVLFECGCDHLIPAENSSAVIKKCRWFLSRVRYRITVLQYVIRIYGYYKNKIIH